MAEYDYNNESKFTVEDCAAQVGNPAAIRFTGTIIDYGETEDVGPFVTMELDERWGFGPNFLITFDLDALEGFH